MEAVIGGPEEAQSRGRGIANQHMKHCNVAKPRLRQSPISHENVWETGTGRRMTYSQT